MADDFWSALGPSIATIGGTMLVADANRQGAQIAGDAAIRGAQIQAEANARAQAEARRYAEEAIARAEAAKQEAQAIYGRTQEQTAPGVTYLRQVAANPGELTPEQQQALIDSRRAIGNTIHNSSFAGSGRSAAALIKRGETDFVNNALTQNRARSDQAASTLAGQHFQAGQGSAQAATTAGTLGANIDTGLGKNIADIEQATGKAQGDANAKAGLYDAQAGIATANSMGKAIGDITSTINNQQRESRYADRLNKLEASLRSSGGGGYGTSN